MICLHDYHQTDYCLLSLEACSHTKIHLKEISSTTPEVTTTTTTTTTSTSSSTTRKEISSTHPPTPNPSVRPFTPNVTVTVKTCEDVYSKNNQNGVYQIDFEGSSKLVYCFWKGNRSFTIIQRRGQFSTPRNFFDKNWDEYRRGFGEPDKEHWLGLDHIYKLTKLPRDLTILLFDKNIKKVAIIILNASLKKVDSDFALEYDAVAAYDEHKERSPSLTSSVPRSGLKFSTRDRNPYPSRKNCADLLTGGWWFDPFKNCGGSNLNGLNYNGPYTNDTDNGIIWKSFRGGQYSLLITRMFVAKPKRKAAFKIVLYSAIDLSIPIGEVKFEEGYGILIMKGAVLDLIKGKHGVSINEYGNLGDGCKRTGKHFNPFHKNHGSPEAEDRHAGDLGNMIVDKDGVVTRFTFLSKTLTIANLSSPLNIKERSFVIHEHQDDLGLTSNPRSKIDGNAGKPVACGIIKGT